MILDYKKAQKRVMSYFKTGGGKTYYVGFKSFGRLYSIKEGGVTDWTGYPQSGKTEFMLECLMNCSKWYGHKHLIYMPDAGTEEEVISRLLHKLTGKQLEQFFYDGQGNRIQIENRLTEAEIYKHLPWILEHFLIYLPESADGKPKAVTPRQFWDYAVEMKDELGIFSAVIDSWNYMYHDLQGMREDKWLEDTLSYRNYLAEKHNIHFHTVIHPSKPQTNKDGTISMPDMYSLKGGSEWANNGKAIIVVHRDFAGQITEIKVAKAKPRIVGVQGITSLKYDAGHGKYYEESIDGRKIYAKQNEEMPF